MIIGRVKVERWLGALISEGAFKAGGGLAGLGCKIALV